MVALALLDKRLPMTWLIQKSVAGSIFITAVEFICGCIVNLWLHMNIWDYRFLPDDLLGQICLPFSGVWFFLSFLTFTAFGIVRALARLFSSVREVCVVPDVCPVPEVCTVSATGDNL